MPPARPHTSRVQIRRTRHFMSEAGLLLRRTLPLLALLHLLPCGVMQQRKERTRGDVHNGRWNILSTTAAHFRVWPKSDIAFVFVAVTWIRIVLFSSYDRCANPLRCCGGTFDRRQCASEGHVPLRGSLQPTTHSAASPGGSGLNRPPMRCTEAVA
jgi:hypothetical protein